ncbi:hypothetical protein COMNV_01492 [Commensalibacter sp. Nvir]|uniref:hypothetical protein n=1 Tax=Commensalibacter sp. Nvir TaxID=3069817 RepID=UPI002D3F97A6|nr:hypothetical protein COMNV_01492 [Commensalibacter sp. Nvir]
MWVTFLNWFLGIFCIILWVMTFALYEKDKVIAWIDNKFGRDDPMPPTPPVAVDTNIEKSISIQDSSSQELISRKNQDTLE